VQNGNHAETTASLDRITAQLTVIQGCGSNSSSTNHSTQDDVKSVLTQTMCENSDEVSTQLRITMSMPLKACEWTCNCQCHTRTQYRTPQWLSSAVGTLFYSSTNTPSIDVRPCNVPSCFRSQPSSSSRFTYYFPTWMMRTVLVYSAWNNLNGKNSSWTIKMPREVTDSPCWHYIKMGSIEVIKELLESRQMSPYDVMDNGMSVLYVSR
jgi:hypothetical protein